MKYTKSCKRQTNFQAMGYILSICFDIRYPDFLYKIQRNKVNFISRSLKKTPIIQDGYGRKSLQWYKRQANKKVRRSVEIHNRKAYRKVYETWTFRDYTFRETFNQYKSKLESDIKHYFRACGSNKYLSRRLNDYYDKNYKFWKKYYYWK